MGDKTAIEWTSATWNPVVGCSIVSPGCTNCYAMKMAGRIARMGGKGGARYAGLTQSSKAGPVWTGEVRLAEEALDLPLRWKRPRQIFVNSMSDLFHEDLPDEAIDRVFAVMALAPQHTFQVLTKRAERMRRYVSGFEARRRDLDCNAGLDWTAWPVRNVWLGVSVEDQERADERIPHLVKTPAAVRFLSCEPLLENLGGLASPCEGARWEYVGGTHPSICTNCGLNPREHLARDIQWVIAGGESGPGARPMHPDWARSLRDQCAAAGVAFFFKQWGEYLPVGQSLPGCGKVHGATAVKPGRMKLHYVSTPKQAPKYAFAERGVEFASTADGRLTFHVGKKAAGRLLDGVEHNAMPAQSSEHQP